MQKVEKTVVEDKKTGKQRKFGYRDIPFDQDGWADAKKYLPEDYDLMFLKTKDKTYNGWSIGTKWDGKSIDSDAEVLYWKRNVY